VQKASPPLDERDKQSLPVAIERGGECAGPGGETSGTMSAAAVSQLAVRSAA
jgi:hypothetical protein